MFALLSKANASGARKAASGLCQALLAAACLLPTTATASPAPGSYIVNTVHLTYGSAILTGSISVQVVADSSGAPAVDVMQYAPPGSPNAAQALTVSLPGMTCNGGSYAPTYSSFASGTLPGMGNLPLLIDDNNAYAFNVGEPVFIRVSDAAANLDPNVQDQVQVTVADSITHDSETLTLRETGANTGVFAGYVNTTSARTQVNDCQLSTAGSDIVTVSLLNGGQASGIQQVATMADPAGVVFDDQSGAPLDNVLVTLVDTTTGLPAQVIGDDGAPNFPNPVYTGHQGYQVGALTYNFAPGHFRFPNVATSGSYRLVVSHLPQSYVAPGLTPAPGSAAAAIGYVLDAKASFGKSFQLSQGQAITVNIPADKPTTGLYITKAASASTAGIGDFVPYSIQVSNSNVSTIDAVSVVDHLPPGLRYRAHSLQINGVAAPDPVLSADGYTFTVTLGDIPTATSVTLTYAVEVTAAAPLGPATNLAQAVTPVTVSNTAQATIAVTEDLMRSKSILTGRVWEGDSCDAADQKPLPGTRIYLEDGSYVITDRFGKWHMDNINPGTHVVQLDKASLPGDVELLDCEKHTRSAGSSFSQFVDVQGGTLWQVDFHVRRKRPPPPIRLRVNETDHVLSGRLTSEMTDGGLLHFTLSVHNPDEDVTSAALTMAIPPGLALVAGSWKLDGQPHADLVPDADAMITAADIGRLAQSATNHELSWDLKPVGASPSGTRDIHAELVATTASGRAVFNADNIALTESREKASRVIVFHPHFASYSTTLTPADEKWLNDIARGLANQGEIRIVVVGHTDNVKVVPRKGRAINDNYALSKARAASVASYLATALHLDADHIASDGKGPDEPVADNKTPAGRAANRRVELQVHAVSRAKGNKLTLLTNDSGEKQQVLRNWSVVPDTGPVPVTIMPDPQPAGAALPGGTASPTAAPATAGVAAPVPVAGGVDAPAATTGASPAVAAPEDPDQLGMLSPHEGDVLPNRIYAVRVRMKNNLTPELSLDGHVIPSDQIGFRDNDGKTVLLVYIGVDFGNPGPHQLTIKGKDPFGNARFTQTVNVVRPGDLTRLVLTPLPDNVADGKTPVRMRVQLVDSSGKVYTAATDLKIIDGNLQPSATTVLDKSLLDQGPKVSVAPDGTVQFAPVTHSGLYTVTLGHEGVTQKVSLYVRPEKRDWILVGLAEGSLADKTLSGNVEALDAAGENRNIWQDGRVAFFAKGQIKGEWLLTLAYDTARNTSSQAFGQVIDPTQYYTVYADATSTSYDAPSKEKLYIRMERDAFYALFGDFNTGLTDTTLSAYNRTMTGFKSEYHDERFDVNTFAANSSQSFVRRDIRGNGTSGIYHLGDTGILPGSDRVRIEIRDHLRPDVVLSSQQLSPFSDYSIDYQTGEVFFRSPVLSQDSNFNPVYIVAEYELQSPGSAQINAGGRAAVKFNDGRGTVGVTVVHEDDGVGGGNLHGLDAQYKITKVDTVKAEVSQSKSQDPVNGTLGGVAHMLEWDRNTKSLGSSIFFNDQGDGFGLGQQSAVAAGLRSYGANERYQLTRFWSLIGTLLNQTSLDSGATQRSVTLGAEYKTDRLTTDAGLLKATANLPDGTQQSGTQATGSARYDLVPNKVTLHTNTAVGLQESANQDFPDLIGVGADYKITKSLTLKANQQFTWSHTGNTMATSAGAAWVPWEGAHVGEDVEHDVDESGDRIMSSLGLGQSVRLSKEWTVESTYDRADKLKGNMADVTAQATQAVIPAAAPAYGPATTNFWAMAVGGAYQARYTKGTLRLEHRVATDDISWNLVGAVYRELDPQLAVAGGVQLTDDNQSSTGTVSDTADFRWSLAWRPDRIRWIVLNRIDLILQTQNQFNANSNGQRIINNLNTSRRWDKDQLSLQYGAKYVFSTINSVNMTGYTDLMGVEWRHDIRENWDVGVQTSILHTWDAGVINPSYGVSVGYTPVANTWVSLGYNFEGVSDRDFADADYQAKGIFLKLRAKFDQDSVRQLWQSARGGVFW